MTTVVRFPDGRDRSPLRILRVLLVAALIAFAAVPVSQILWPLETPVAAQRVQFRDAIACDQSEKLSTAAGPATSQIVALTAGQRISVCGFVLSGGGATTAKFVRGTGVNCGTGTQDVTAAFELGDNVTIPFGSGVGTVFRLPAGEALCVTNGAAIQLSVHLVYAKF